MPESRNELLDYDIDPSYDRLTNDLPYLDPVVHETLRLHPPFSEAARVAAEDDMIPLSQSIHTASGELVESLTIAKGTQNGGSRFAITEFKVVMGVPISNFVFELRDGVHSKIEIGGGMLPRPKVAGEVGCKSPLRVRPYTG